MNRLLGASLLSLACAAFAADGVGSFSIVVEAGGIGERCLKLAAGQAIRYDFRADAPVDFNIHFHAGKDVHYPIRQSGVREAKGSFRARRTEDYCLMWDARGERAVAVVGSVEAAR